MHASGGEPLGTHTDELAPNGAAGLPEASVDPHPSRLDPSRPDRAEIVAAHRMALFAGEDGYIDPASGYQVLTASYLWARGSCCANGCRHCPFVHLEGHGSPA